MKRVIFTSNGKINNTKYAKGDKENVSASIFKDLTENQKCAKEYKEKKSKKVT